MKRKTKAFDWTRGLLFVWWVIRFTLALYGSNGGDTGTVEAGDLSRQLLAISLAGIGLLHWRRAMATIKRANGLWWTLLLAYVAWSCCTLLWSAEPALTVRRLIQFLVCGVAWVGLGAGYYGGEDGPTRFCNHFRIGCLIMIAMSLPVLIPELTLTNLMNPLWESEIRRLSTDPFGAAALGLIACVTPFGGDSKYKLSSAWSAGVITLFLIVVKSRSILSLSVLVFVYLLIGTVQWKVVRSTMRIFLIGCVLFILFGGMLGNVMGGAVGEFIARGNTQRVLSEMNGRLPLWNYVWNDIEQVYFRGVGFGAYWNEQKMGEVFRAFGWHAPFAHNGYLDEWVQTGLIGLSLFLAFLVATIIKLKRMSRKSYSANVASTWIILFLLLNFFDSYLQNVFRIPFMGTMVITFSCLSTVYQRGQRFSNSFPDAAGRAKVLAGTRDI